MSNREYFDICEKDDWQKEQSLDPDYPVISIDYSEKSWQQFSADLLNPDSQLMKDLSAFIEGGKSC